MTQPKHYEPRADRYLAAYTAADAYTLQVELAAFPGSEREREEAMAAAHRERARAIIAKLFPPTDERLQYPPEGEDAW